MTEPNLNEVMSDVFATEMRVRDSIHCTKCLRPLLIREGNIEQRLESKWRSLLRRYRILRPRHPLYFSIEIHCPKCLARQIYDSLLLSMRSEPGSYPPEGNPISL